MRTTDGKELKKGNLYYTKEGTQAVLVDFARLSGEPKYMINLFYEGEVFYAKYHQCYETEIDVPYEHEDDERPIIVSSIFKNPPTEKICTEIKEKQIELANKNKEIVELLKDVKEQQERYSAIRKICKNLYKALDPLKNEYIKLKEDITRARDKKNESESTLYRLNCKIATKESYYDDLCRAVLQFKMGNKDLEKIPESSEIIHLREESRILDALRAGGVDNWEWYEESLSALEREED